MKRCIKCNAVFSSSDTSCPDCGWAPALDKGFPVFSPALAGHGAGFKAEYFGDLAELESKNFWFRARNRLIIWAIGKYCPDFQSFLEVGCGTGYVLSGISSAYPQAKLYGSEIFSEGLVFAASRAANAGFMQLDARDIPFIDEYDAVGAFDVLEHIEEDRQVLSQMHKALKPRGILLLTVPQHAWLWSYLDEYACHVRRYSARELHAKIEGAGFEVLRSTSFVSSLLPAMLVSRVRQRKNIGGCDATKELKIPPWLNRILLIILSAEALLIRIGINFPVGGSRLVVARKL